ncbi:MAG: FecR domain-containing protein [Tannerellaceae bacterium]|jgi:ferric-dicitrate binding protein FerR (iron transport regulator)|nr:FecR domain-containing protein [Tannerellaceae bacterium]
MSKSKENTRRMVARYIYNVYSEADAHALFDGVKEDDDVRRAVEEMMDKVWSDALETPDSGDDRSLSQAEMQQWLKPAAAPVKRKTLRLPSLLRYAAVFLLLLAGAGLYLLYSPSGEAEQELPYTETRVEKGRQEQKILADGTRVVLNAGTSLAYPERFDRESRTIRLDGEAFFDVARDKHKPFIVETRYAVIRVIGTAFNVKAHEEDEFISVTVEKGKVQVETGEAMMQVSPGEQFWLDKTTLEIHKKRENTASVKSWISGGLYFNKTPIQSVVNELSRRYDCAITFQKGKAHNEYISGEHDNKTLEAVLNSIYYTTGINYRKEADSIVLYE